VRDFIEVDVELVGEVNVRDPDPRRDDSEV